MSEAQQNMDWAICHYEDEPQRVDFPDLIESILFQYHDVSSSNISSNTEMCEHDITFTYNGICHRIYYAIYPTIEEMQTFLSSKSLDPIRILLNIVDLSINGDREFGISIVKNIANKGSGGDIWFLTGYPVDAKRLLEENGLMFKVIPKPANHRIVVNDIVGNIISRISADSEK